MEETTSQDQLPQKCQECARLSIQSIHDDCGFCRDLGFQEEILCELNRCVQDSASFECHAFQQLLKLVGAPGKKDPAFSGSLEDYSPQKAFRKLLDSDRFKYQRALALQKIKSDPEGVFMMIRYHFAWNVSNRRSLFSQPGKMFDFMTNILTDCGERVGGLVSLLWLAPDHIHLYVESDGEQSPDSIAQEIKRFSTAPVLAELNKQREDLIGEKMLWDEAYFVETVG